MLEATLQATRILVLDELDTLLPTPSTFGPRAAERKKKEIKRDQRSPAEEFLRAALAASSATDLQAHLQ